MKLIILAAGYATRLYPLTLNRPKPLLPIAGKPMIDHVLKSLASISAIDHVYLVTNEKFSVHFEEWSLQSPFHSNLPHGFLMQTIMQSSPALSLTLAHPRRVYEWLETRPKCSSSFKCGF